jgi:isopenicillin-N epimerase
MEKTPHEDALTPLAADAWGLDPAVIMLNHGGFGACPRPVLQLQQRLRAELEGDPTSFFEHRMQPLLDASREVLAQQIGADPIDVAFVSNATAGVNSVLRSRPFQPGDEILVTDHGYNACRNVAEFVASRSGARVMVSTIPVPLDSPEQIIAAVIARTTARTRLVLIDHVTSPTAVVFPIEPIVRELDRRGIDTLVDGAHAPGMVPLSVTRLGAAYYAGNCHKWLCAPKGAGFLYVRRDKQPAIQPSVISHGYNTPRAGRSQLHTAFDWQGTQDPTAWLCVGEAIRFLLGLLDGGIDELARRNHRLAIAARHLLCARLGLKPTCDEALIGSTAAFFLPEDRPAAKQELPPGSAHPWHGELRQRFGIQVPVYYWPSPPHKVLRISTQAYNSLGQYERLCEALATLL